MASCLSSVNESASDVTCFMNVFERVLPLLVSSDDENTPPLLTTHPLTPVLGTNTHTHSLTLDVIVVSIFRCVCVPVCECLPQSDVLPGHEASQALDIHCHTL